MIYSLYRIKTKTNMHVGSGDTTFGVIDNKVQRDVLTNYPIIHSSSLKGALREYFKEYNDSIVDYIFGSKPKDNENQTSGKYRFFDANLLSYPVRSDKKLFYRATTSSIIKKFLERMREFHLENNFSALEKLENVSESGTLRNDGNIEIEDFKVNHLLSPELTGPELKQIEKLLGDKVVLFNEDDFKTIIEDLPVVARNHLVNGESKNLWYEEIVPRETKFYFFVGIGTEKEVEFNDGIQGDLVQIGGNASIGYGFSSITKIL